MSEFVFEPSVYVVGRQEVLYDELQEFLEDEDASDWGTDTDIPAQVLPEVAGRICYDSYSRPRPGGNKAYLGHILESGHGSVLEHAVWSIVLTGISRSLAQELLRQRTGLSPSMASMRYIDESRCRFVVPPYLHDEVREALKVEHDRAEGVEYTAAQDAGFQWIHSVRFEQSQYVDLVEYLLAKTERLYPDLAKTEARKKARQSARSVLPHATETKIFLTGNARAWRHFIDLRANRHADDEIRILAGLIYDRLLEEAPHIFGDYSVETLLDGTRELRGK